MYSKEKNKRHTSLCMKWNGQYSRGRLAIKSVPCQPKALPTQMRYCMRTFIKYLIWKLSLGVTKHLEGIFMAKLSHCKIFSWKVLILLQIRGLICHFFCFVLYIRRKPCVRIRQVIVKKKCHLFLECVFIIMKGRLWNSTETQGK